MAVNSLPKSITRQRCGCDLNPGSTAPESSTLTTRLPMALVSCKHRSHCIHISSGFTQDLLFSTSARTMSSLAFHFLKGFFQLQQQGMEVMHAANTFEVNSSIFSLI